MYKNYYSARFTFFICLLAWCVIMLGAYTRLKDAGLGCPDWPGCYGQITVPQTSQELALAKIAYPHQPVETSKAWAEMVHRYFVGVLGVLILSLGITTYQKRQKDKKAFELWLAIAGVVIFQALLGKWTVTMRLLPTVVMGHLLGGMTLLVLLWLLFLRYVKYKPPLNQADKVLRKWAITGLGLVVFQIFLGGWTSANYAALVCPDFPLCHGQLMPPLNLSEAFNFLMTIGPNFQGGVLTDSARTTIQWAHRIGALLVATYMGWFGIRCMLAKTHVIRCLGLSLLAILTFQIVLGILNVKLMLPMFVAVAHNGAAALLLLCVITLLHYLYLTSFQKIKW